MKRIFTTIMESTEILEQRQAIGVGGEKGATLSAGRETTG